VPDELLTIGELARRTGRRPSSIRYYEQIGLLPTPMRVGGQRRYRPDLVETMTVIEVARRAGLRLEQIKAVLGPGLGAMETIAELRRVTAARLRLLTAEIARAEQARAWLESASACQCPSLKQCPLFGA
jgi:DNA-binding transcriptional MerR regulator